MHDAYVHFFFVVLGFSGILPLLLIVIGKSLKLQVRTKGQAKENMSVNMSQALVTTSSVWMRGVIQDDIAVEVLALIKLLSTATVQESVIVLTAAAASAELAVNGVIGLAVGQVHTPLR